MQNVLRARIRIRARKRLLTPAASQVASDRIAWKPRQYRGCHLQNGVADRSRSRNGYFAMNCTAKRQFTLCHAKQDRATYLWAGSETRCT